MIMVFITKATSDGSGEPAHPRSLTRAFAVRTHEVWKKMKGLRKIRHLSPLDGCACVMKNEFTEDEKYHNLMTWLKCVCTATQ